ncbi:hypothetical protein [Microbacterium sp.]|uniref:hypothetical protein n=1 Tax=Microbacterium sp. TaxID=51671 RepID=UPI003A8BB23D
MTNESLPARLPHGLRPMRARDPHETHRAATPLELPWISVVGYEAYGDGHIRRALAEL